MKELHQVFFPCRKGNIRHKNLHDPLLSVPSKACPLRLWCPCVIRKGRGHCRGALVVIGEALDALTSDQGRLPPGTPEDGLPRDPCVCPEKRGGGGGARFRFAGGTDNDFTLIRAGPPMVRGAIEREELPEGHRCFSFRRQISRLP